MKEVIGKLERILELTSTHGIVIQPSNETATSDDQLMYVESKIRLNAIQALDLFDKNNIDKEKARYKVGYERVNFEDTMSMFGDEVEIESDLFFQWSENNVVKVSEVSGRDLIMNRHKLVRKVEEPIEWWEDAADFINNSDKGGGARFQGSKLIVDGSLTRDQWCDFARILLEQND